MDHKSFVKESEIFLSHLFDLVNKSKNEASISISLEGECSQFMRFNNNQMRQYTDVHDLGVNITLHKNKRSYEANITVQGNLENDLKTIEQQISKMANEVDAFPEDLSQVEMKNNGTSSESKWGEILGVDVFSQQLFDTAKDLDFTGVYTSGVILRGNVNSLGQKHFYSTENFILDYSLFNNENAAKGCYSGTNWKFDEFKKDLFETKTLLEKMSLPVQEVDRGDYRVYLAPSAVSEILGVLSWGALSESAYQQGMNGLKKLKDGHALSDLFTLKENLDLGLGTPFNSIGELMPSSLSLIENGKLNTYLVSSRTAKEYDLISNQAENYEFLTSPEITQGNLKESDVLKKLDTGIYISNLHYLNWSDRNEGRITGMTRYACFWVEAGVIKGPIKDLRFDESLYNIFGDHLEDLTDFRKVEPETRTYGSRNLGGSLVPGLLNSSFKFTL